MKRYFYFIGVLELLGFVAGFVLQLIKLCLYSNQLSGFDIATNIIVLIVLLIVGPALGLLFISHADNIDGGSISLFKSEKDEDKTYICPGDKVEFKEDYKEFKKGDRYNAANITYDEGKVYIFIYKDYNESGFIKVPFDVLKKVN